MSPNPFRDHSGSIWGSFCTQNRPKMHSKSSPKASKINACIRHRFCINFLQLYYSTSKLPNHQNHRKTISFSMISANPACYIYVNLSSDLGLILVPKNLQNRIPNRSKTVFAFAVDSENDYWLIWNSIFDNFGYNFGPVWLRRSIQKQSEIVLGVFSVSKSLPKCLPIRFGIILGAFGDHFWPQNRSKIDPRRIQSHLATQPLSHQAYWLPNYQATNTQIRLAIKPLNHQST